MDRMSDRDFEGLFPRDVLGRIVLGFCSLFFLPLFGGFLVGLWFLPRPQAPLESAISWAASVFLGTLVAYFLTGLIWAIAQPKWLEPVVEVVASKVARVARLTSLTAIAMFLLLLLAVALAAFLS
jgi:hypothetical protein